jgi:plasmid stabilization system protein ParE
MNSQILRIHNAADKEISDAKAWYLVRSIKAASGFADELERALNRILDDPLMGPQYLRGVRRVQLHRYPYLVVYKVHGDVIRIYAIAHTSRRSGYWANRRFDTEAP